MVNRRGLIVKREMCKTYVSIIRVSLCICSQKVDFILKRSSWLRLKAEFVIAVAAGFKLHFRLIHHCALPFFFVSSYNLKKLEPTKPLFVSIIRMPVICACSSTSLISGYLLNDIYPVVQLNWQHSISLQTVVHFLLKMWRGFR